MIRLRRRFSLLLVGLFALIGVLSPRPTRAQSGVQCFTVPGITNCIQGRFFEYWHANGGLEVFGYPITPEYLESTAEGNFTVQYFERNRLELHLDQQRPYDVLVGRLGAARLSAQGRNWESAPKADPSAPHYFALTGHAVAHAPFWDYWRTHGLELGDRGISERESLALFGLPLTEPALEMNANGDTVLTQWFERARFEYHNNSLVLLGLLGREARSDVAAPPVVPAPQPAPPAPQPAPPAPRPAPAPNPCAGIAAPRYAVVEPNCVRYGEDIKIRIYGNEPHQQMSYWVTKIGAGTVGATRTLQVDETGAYEAYLSTVDWGTLPGDYVFVAQDVEQKLEQSIAPFRVLPSGSTPAPAPAPPRPAPTPPPAPAPAPPRPAPTPVPQGRVQTAAAVSNPNPSQNTDVTVYGRFTVDGRPVNGVQMDTVWHYRTTTPGCSGRTGPDGEASCTRYISGATRGYRVIIDVIFTYNGQRYTTQTSFTPR